jgi:hypothetical protein
MSSEQSPEFAAAVEDRDWAALEVDRLRVELDDARHELARASRRIRKLMSDRPAGCPPAAATGSESAQRPANGSRATMKLPRKKRSEVRGVDVDGG